MAQEGEGEVLLGGGRAEWERDWQRPPSLILSPMSGLEARYGVSQVCARELAGADLRSPVVEAEALLGARG